MHFDLHDRVNTAVKADQPEVLSEDSVRLPLLVCCVKQSSVILFYHIDYILYFEDRPVGSAADHFHLSRHSTRSARIVPGLRSYHDS